MKKNPKLRQFMTNIKEEDSTDEEERELADQLEDIYTHMLTIMDDYDDVSSHTNADTSVV